MKKRIVKAKSISEKQRIFAREYVQHGIGKEAARAAGYSAGALLNMASRLIRNPVVIAEIDRLRKEALTSAIADARECHGVLTSIIRGSLADFIDESGELRTEAFKDPAKVRALESVVIEDVPQKIGPPLRRVKLKMGNRIEAIARLAKMLGWDAQPDASTIPAVNVTILNTPPLAKG